MTVDYARYLAAKTTVDDRSLNRHVLAELRRLMPAGAPRVLEVGAGLGTMVARLLDWGVVSAGEYVLLDADRQLLDCSRRWLREACAVTRCRMGCGWVISGCACCMPSSAVTWRPLMGRGPMC